jgi:hypothetical protein
MNTNINQFKLVTFIIINLLSTIALSQNLSLVELIKIHTSKTDDANFLLINKNWTFLNSEYGNTKWAFNKNGEKARAWIEKPSNKKYPLRYQNSYIKHINSIKVELTQLGFKRTDSYVLTNKIITKYKNLKYIVALELFSSRDVDDFNNERNVFVVTVETLPTKEEQHQINLQIKRDSTYAATFMYSQDEYAEQYPKSITFVSKQTFLRDKFDDDAEIISELNIGEVVYIFNDRLYNKYCLVYCENKVGFILKESLEKYDKSKINQVNNKTINKTKFDICTKYLYKATLAATLPEYMWLLDEKTYTDEKARLLELPEGAELYVIDEPWGDDIFSRVCYNGVMGYISKNILIKD